MTDSDRREFQDYLRTCTDAQVQGCYDKERAAGRRVQMQICRDEAEARGLALS